MATDWDSAYAVKQQVSYVRFWDPKIPLQLIQYRDHGH